MATLLDSTDSEPITRQPDENTVWCPNCRALNPPNTLVCTGCGVNLAEFRAALPRIRDLQDRQASAHREQLEGDVSPAIAREAARSRKQLYLQLQVALAVAAVLAILVVIGTAWFAHQQQLRRQRLAAQYAAAATCLNEGDYLCARDGFEALLKEEPDYQDAQEQLSEARYGLAQQHVRAGQWRDAVTELDVLLEEKPDDARALALLRETYDRWFQDALGRGDWLTALSVALQRSARFPPED